MARIYLDHNATTPLRPEARQAMLDAMNAIGNPSSVHAEGRAARSLVEQARAQIAAAFGAEGADVIFTSGATESAALACAGRELHGAAVEHDAIRAWIREDLCVDREGRVRVTDAENSVLQLANSETGVLQDLPGGLAVSDMTQAFGKIATSFNWSGVQMALISAHKFGGPKGIGALLVRHGTEVRAQIRGGGQEMGRRAGTENIIGIAGFGAAAEAAARDLEAGVWGRVQKLRNILENTIAQFSKETTFVGQSVLRLPNSSCFMTPGWKGETQVMAMDLDGFAISAGSACSSGKVRASAVLNAMGFEQTLAQCAVRVSLGPKTTEEEVMRFAESWIKRWLKHKGRMA